MSTINIEQFEKIVEFNIDNNIKSNSRTWFFRNW